MRTDQQLFDTVVNHLRQQNARCQETDGVCLYRDGKGMKCAVGCLIPDEMYSPKMEKNDLDALLYRGLLPDDLYQEFNQHRELLKSLQRVHDDYPCIAWERRLQDVAHHYNLVWTPKP